MFKKLNQLSAETDEFMKRLQKMAQESFAPALAEAVNDLKTIFPDAIGLWWNQYTPYFNDGDECIFGLQGAYLKVSEELADEDDYQFDLDYLDKKQFSESQRNAASKFYVLLGNLENVLKMVYGDHVRVDVDFKTGKVSTDTCDHD